MKKINAKLKITEEKIEILYTDRNNEGNKERKSLKKFKNERWKKY